MQELRYSTLNTLMEHRAWSAYALTLWNIGCIKGSVFLNSGAFEDRRVFNKVKQMLLTNRKRFGKDFRVYVDRKTYI